MNVLRLARRYGPMVVLAVVALIAWRTADAADIDEEPQPAVAYENDTATPVLSARRIPRSLQAPLADDAVQPAIDTLLVGSPADTTCLIVMANGRPIAAQHAELPVVPASNQKIITTYAALTTFGPEHTFTTTAVSAAPVTDGVLDGDLYLVGGGDPFLSTDSWWTQYDNLEGRAHTRLEDLADQIAGQGITTITGSIVGDESMLDTVRVGPWAQRLIDTQQSGPLSALAVNQGYVSWPETYEGSSRPRVPTDNPPEHAAGALAALLEARGVATGGVASGPAPLDAALIGAVESPPLAELVTHVNSYSDNFGAEILLKHIGLQRGGVGSTEVGAVAMTDALAERGLDLTGTVLTDGSGLSESTTVTCSLLHGILLDAGFDSVLAESLSIGGQRGSLVNQYEGDPASGHVYAKTGTLNGVTALSGYVYSLNEAGTTVTFAYVANGELVGQDNVLRGLQEPFTSQLATYPNAPPIESLSPLSPVPNPDQGEVPSGDAAVDATDGNGG